MNTSLFVIVRKLLVKCQLIFMIFLLVMGANGQALAASTALGEATPRGDYLPDVMLSGTVIDADTALPIEHAKVEVQTGEYVYTDVGGYYNLVVAEGTYTVTASAPYYITEFVTGIVVDEGTVVVDFDLVHTPVILTGVVEDSYNRLPLSGAKVQLNTGEYVITGADGIYAFSLKPGVYDLTASLADYITQTITGVTLVAEQVLLDIDLVHYPLPVTITGLVTDAYHLTGIQGATVALDTGQTYNTGPSGRYSFMIDPGVYTMTVSAPGYITQINGPLTIILGTLVVDYALVPSVCPTVAIEGVSAEAQDLQVSFIPDIYPLLGITYAWDFGDGSTSTEEAPTHTYAAYGTYTVTLDVVNICGETDTWVSQVIVTKMIIPQFTFLPMTVKY